MSSKTSIILCTYNEAKYIENTKSYQITMIEMLGGTILISLYLVCTKEEKFYLT